MELNSRDADVVSIFGKGLQAHNAGDLNTAEQFYQETLSIQPNHSEANHNIGVVLATKNELNKALKFFKYALDNSPNVSLFWASYIDALIKLGRIAESKTLTKAVTDAGLSCEKMEAISQRLEIEHQEPGETDTQKLDELIEQKRFDDVQEKCLSLLETYPSSAVLNINLGKCYFELGQTDQAILYYKKATEYQPQWVTSYILLGQLFSSKGKADEAIECLQKAIELQSENPELYAILGAELLQNNEPDEAIPHLQKAIKFNPKDAASYFNLGNALQTEGSLKAAIESYQQAINIQPENADAYLNIAAIQQNIGDLDGAITNFQQVIKLKPECESSLVQKLHLQAHICDWASRAKNRKNVHNLGTSHQRVDPFALLEMEDAPLRHRLRSEVFASTCRPEKPLSLSSKPIRKPKRLRIGYFSADFHNHATMYLMAKLFESHDPTKFKIYAYSFGPDKNDKMRQRVVKAVDFFRDVRKNSDKAIAQLAQKDKIDIAVDLKGYTQLARPCIFSYRAAPIQISYLGYPGTSGGAFMDYIIADKVVIPKPFETSYSENIIHLPHSYQVNDNTRTISESIPTKLEMGLPENGFVFCCFNSNYKISPSAFNIWMHLLREVKGSVLWLLKSNQWAKHNLCAEAESRGISANRLVFAEPISQAKHLARLRLADLFIDTFNIN